jgi:hypothetical protein
LAVASASPKKKTPLVKAASTEVLTSVTDSSLTGWLWE